MVNDQQRRGRHRRPRRSPSQSSAHAQPTSDPQPGSAANAAGTVLGSSSNTMVNGGNFTAAASVSHRNVTININEGVSQTPSQTENCDLRETARRGRNGRRRGPMRPQEYSTIPAQRINEIYEQNLQPQQRGCPLWIPQPNMALSIPYRAQGVRVGDVGLITEDGGFDFLFNIRVPRDDPINPPELPDHFLPISISPTDIRKFSAFSPGSYLKSSTVVESQTAEQTSALIFESSASEGAILTMPEGACSEDLCNRPRFNEYIATHAKDWYRFVNGPRGREANNGDLRVVAGSDKTTSWGMAAFANSTLSQHTNSRLIFRPEQPSNWNGGNSYAWEQSGAQVKVGPGRSENEELGETPANRLQNQCLFLRTMPVMLSEPEWKELFPQAVVVTDQNSLHLGVSYYPHASSPGYVRGKPSQSQNLPSGQGYSSTGKKTSDKTLSYLSENEKIHCDLTSMPDVTLTCLSSSNDILHPSKLISRYLLQQYPHARVSVIHDRDWNDTDHADASQMLSVVLSKNDIVFDNDTGLIFLELKEESHENGMISEEVKFAKLIESIKDGKLTLDQYLFESHGATHCLHLQDLCTALQADLTVQPISKTSFLTGHPKRPLSLDELLKLCNGGSTHRQSILDLRAELDSLPPQHAN